MKTFTHYGNREFVFGNGTLTDLPHYVSGGGPALCAYREAFS